MKSAILCFLPAVVLSIASPAYASSHTARECREGADFIKNAALSRLNGQTREVFLDRLHGDLSMIRGMPVAQRWFVRDKADESLLILYVERVFDSPSSPEIHQEAFLGECVKNLDEGKGAQTV